MDGWTWVEGTINAPPQAVFEFLADESANLSLLVPQSRVVGTPVREKLPNGGQRVHLRTNLLWRTQEMVAEDTAFEPYALLRGWSRSRTGAIEGEKRLAPTAEGTHIVWGARVIERRGVISKLAGLLAPAYGRLATRIALLQLVSRSRAALEVSPAPQAVTEPAWTAARMPVPTPVPFGWLRFGTLVIGVLIALVIDTVLEIVWPSLSVSQALHLVSFVIYLALVLLCVELLSLMALRLVPTRLPDSR